MMKHSVGQLVVDALASWLGIRLSSVRGGFSGQGNVYVGETLVDLTLFKSSMWSQSKEKLQLMALTRIPHEHIGSIYSSCLPSNCQFSQFNDNSHRLA